MILSSHVSPKAQFQTFNFSLMLVLSKKVVTSLVKSTESDKRGCLSTLTLLILKLSKVSFSDILRNDYLDHFDTFGENFDFDTFKNDTFESV